MNTRLKLFGHEIVIKKINKKDTKEFPSDLRWALEIIKKYGEEIPLKPSKKKIESAKRASEIKVKRAKEKVQNAVNLLRLQGEEVTPYKVAKIAGISYNTAKKYLQDN